MSTPRPRSLLSTVAAAALLAAALVPVSASASSVFVSSGQYLYYYADPGEVNDLSVTRVAATLTLTDPGATIVPASADCSSVNIHQATCTGAAIRSVSVDLVDKDDHLVISAGGISTGISGGDGKDTLAGGPGQDYFSPGSGDDVASGGAGFDSFDDSGSGDGADSISGGGDFDYANYDSHTGPVGVDADGVADDGEDCPGPGCEGDNIKPDVEAFGGTAGDDVLIGNGGPNSIYGSGGDDTIQGGAGADSLNSANGDDTVHGGGGADHVFGSEGSDRIFGDKGDDVLFSAIFDDDQDLLSGGGGTDLVDYRGANSAIRIDLDGKPDDGVAGEKDNVKPDVEDVFGSNFDDVIIGGRGANEFEGFGGNDRLSGGRGLDGMIGGDGDDNLNGGKGRDLLEGDGGADRITSRDRDPDEVECGSAFDRVTADRADRISADCDRVKR